MAELLTHLRKLVLVHEDLCIEIEKVALTARKEDSLVAKDIHDIRVRTDAISTDLKRIADQLVDQQTFELEVEDTTDWKPETNSDLTGEVMPSPFDAPETSEDSKAKDTTDQGAPKSNSIDNLLRSYIDEPSTETVLHFVVTTKMAKYECKSLDEERIKNALARPRTLLELQTETQLSEKVLRLIVARFVKTKLVEQILDF